MNILELAILKQMVGGGGGSGTDNYNDLSNLPQINGETLVGNKTAANLGLQDALTFDGVYNASTNKAATESTVTNAIAGLDVSAFSVDADETISSISEIDGKISVTKQDIAIASNQVVAMTGYTKPSSAPATPAIQQGDTANTAFGKLEYKADTNQTNILSTQNMICDTEFSTSTAYAVGDYVTYNNSLYEFTSAHSAGDWTGNDVTEVNVTDMVSTKIGSSDYASQNTGGTVRVWTTTVGSDTVLHISNQAAT